MYGENFVHQSKRGGGGIQRDRLSPPPHTRHTHLPVGCHFINGKWLNIVKERSLSLCLSNNTESKGKVRNRSDTLSSCAMKRDREEQRVSVRERERTGSATAQI